MRIMTITLAALGAMALLAGCNRAESPAEVKADVAAASEDAASKVEVAESSAQKDVQEERKELDKTYDNASDKVASATKDVVNAQAQGDYNVAIAAATADHKIAIEKCEALSGDAQKSCKNKADAELTLARANAETALARKKS